MDQLLTQEEVDALLRGITEGDVETEQDDRGEAGGVRLYDFTSHERITRGRMPILEIINQRFSRLFRASLSAALRWVIDVNLIRLEMTKFGEFLKTLPVPTSIHIFRMSPLRGAALLVIESKLVFALVDSFFGGTGAFDMKIKGRDFTAIESRMIHRVVEIIFQDLEKAWRPVEPIKITLERSEINPQLAGIVSPSDVAMVMPFNVEIDRSNGLIILCIPYSTLQIIQAKLQASIQSATLEIDESSQRWIIDHIREAKVDVSVELGSTEITGRDLLNLQVGDIIRLDQDSDSELIVQVERMPKFKGFPRVIKGRKVIQFTARIPRKVEEDDDG